MRNAGWLLAFAFLAASCSRQGHIPRDILSKDSMKVILWDVMTADQYSQQILIHDSSRLNLRSATLDLYSEIFQRHHITRDAFEKSYSFYMEHPDIGKELFDSLSVFANRERQEQYRSASRPGQPASPKPAGAIRPLPKP